MLYICSDCGQPFLRSASHYKRKHPEIKRYTKPSEIIPIKRGLDSILRPVPKDLLNKFQKKKDQIAAKLATKKKKEEEESKKSEEFKRTTRGKRVNYALD